MTRLHIVSFKPATFFFAATLCLMAHAQESLDVPFGENLSWFLPKDVTYDASVPTPDAFLGYRIGEWHARHDQVVGYMQLLAEVSGRITIEEYGRSVEGRPLVLLTITSPGNHANIDRLRSEHVLLSDPETSRKMDTGRMPVVVYMGYSVHGNEASGMNAALLVAYHLAAAQGPGIDSALNNAVILLDPCFNPDGGSRFASWVNAHKSGTPVGNPHSRELNEAWPTGRTNHYWFDLNRDWLPVQHVETAGRIENFHRWKPNVLTDHHEMSTNSTFFFQPGVPSRINPLTPARNHELTAAIAKFHAAALDKIGSLYYTRESFDDFYYGKGSTYPDVNGAIGILFEQASARGHLQESVHGPLTFAFAIRNQFTTSLSTLAASVSLRRELLDFQREFYLTAIAEAKKDDVQAYMFSSRRDVSRLYHFLELLEHHRITVHRPAKDLTVNGQAYPKTESLILPLEQAQYRLIKSMFESYRSFEDSLFYDISSWTMPMAFDLQYDALDKKSFSASSVGENVRKDELPGGKLHGERSDYGYVFEWNEYYSPRALNSLLAKNLVVKVATKPFTCFTAAGSRDFGYGTILIPAQRQGTFGETEMYRFLQDIAARDRINIYSLSTGLTLQGVDIGSPSFRRLARPKTLMLAGNGMDPYDAGEVWHLLDVRYQMELVMVEPDLFSGMDFSGFTTVVLVDGNYGAVTPDAADKLRKWVEDGGTVIAMRSAVKWCRKHNLANVKFRNEDSKADSADVPLKRPYAFLDRDRGAQVIGGAIFEAKLDLTHPIGYGYDRSLLPVFRMDTAFYLPSRNAYATPLTYTASPLLSGYISDQKHELLKSSAAIIVNGLGKGKVVCMADNPNFRAFWYGTNRLFMNALFFAPVIDRNAVEEIRLPKKSEQQEKGPTY